MPARDIYHTMVKQALIADGWIITHDPYHLAYDGKDAYVDLGKDYHMETLSRYRQSIISVLRNLAGRSVQSEAETFCLFDTQHDQYLVLKTGWHDIQRTHTVLAHIRLCNAHVWVEVDNTDQEIVQQLLDAGIPQHDIVLAFYSPHKRRLTAFAVA